MAPLARVAAAAALLSALAAAACTTDADCNYNGVCGSSGECVCDLGWGGPSLDCGVLNLSPVPADAGRNGFASNSSSWGGAVMEDPDAPGTYHMFFARFELGCGLNAWGNNSVVVHATSQSPLGPFADEEVVVPSWSHGPKIARAADGTYLLYYIGLGDDPASRLCQCAAHGGSEAGCRAAPLPASGIPVDGRGYVTFAYSKSLAGPWTQWGRPVLEAELSWELWVSNPAPWAMPDGSILLAYRVVGTPPSTGSSGSSSGSSGGSGSNDRNGASSSSSSAVGRTSEMIGVASAPAWNATFSRLTKEPAAVGPEDPFIWIDKRGNAHILTHSGCGHGHLFSPASSGAGFLTAWTTSPTHAVPCVLTWQNGTVAPLARRERPQLLFAAGGTMEPLVLYSGVQPFPSGQTDFSFTLAAPVAH